MCFRTYVYHFVRTSVFSAVANAIELALQHVKYCNIAKVIIFSDFLSCLQAIKNCQLKTPLILDILELHEIVICWLPGHVGIKGNTLADFTNVNSI